MENCSTKPASGCRIALIGAGSYVFGPSLLHQAIVEHRLPGLHLALVDPDGEAAELMAAVGRRMAADCDLDALVTAHTERAGALDGADYVICSAAAQMQRRFAMDRAIIDSCMPAHLVTEFGGVAGLSYSLRQIALISGIVADMKRLCPQAWLLDAANPLPRICQAAHELGVRTAGFCSVSLVAYGMVRRIFEGRSDGYPFDEPRQRWDAVIAGTNHLTWLVELRERATGEDVMPRLRARLAEGATTGQSRTDELARETGYLPAPGDDHIRDFLPPVGTHSADTAWHGDPGERARRMRTLAEVADGRRSCRDLIEHPAWERPVDLIAALSYRSAACLHSINLVNDGQVPDLPRGVFVETHATCSGAGVEPRVTSLPAAVAPYCRAAAEVTSAIVQGALHRDRRPLHEAVALDPTILDKAAGRAAVDQCLVAHEDLIGKYA